MQHIFLSDVHLGAFHSDFDDQLEQDLTGLVNHCRNHHIGLHFLGDVFDYWMEFPGYTPPLGRRLLDTLETYNRTVRPATYITGNHDHWTMDHFAGRGFRVEHEYVTMCVDETSIFMLHGDGLSDPDMELPRPLLNRILRHPRFVTFFRMLFSGESGNHAMKMFSEFTRDETDIHPGRLSRWAKKMLKESQTRYLIAGHDHMPRTETFNDSTYINTGAFYRDRTVARYTNGTMELVIWNGQKKCFTPFNREDEPALQ